jgi:Tfp pilus assembly protein PilN
MRGSPILHFVQDDSAGDTRNAKARLWHWLRRCFVVAGMAPLSNVYAYAFISMLQLVSKPDEAAALAAFLDYQINAQTSRIALLCKCMSKRKSLN